MILGKDSIHGSVGDIAYPGVDRRLLRDVPSQKQEIVVRELLRKRTQTGAVCRRHHPYSNRLPFDCHGFGKAFHSILLSVSHNLCLHGAFSEPPVKLRPQSMDGIGSSYQAYVSTFEYDLGLVLATD